MNNQNTITNLPTAFPTPIFRQNIISTQKFLLFSILSLGLYQIWWMYKEWEFFEHKDKLNISPVLRAIFCVFFLYSLFKHIQIFAHENLYTKAFSSLWLFLAYILTPVLISTIDTYGIITIATTTLYLVPAFQASNYAKKNSTLVKVIELKKMTTPQIILVVIGSLFWLMLFTALIFEWYYTHYNIYP